MLSGARASDSGESPRTRDMEATMPSRDANHTSRRARLCTPLHWPDDSRDSSVEHVAIEEFVASEEFRLNREFQRMGRE